MFDELAGQYFHSRKRVVVQTFCVNTDRTTRQTWMSQARGAWAPPGPPVAVGFFFDDFYPG